MKKFWLIGGLLCCMSIWARTPEQAACVASEFLSSKNTPAVRRMQQAEKAATVTAPVEIAYTQMQVDNEPAVYVFNGEDGFVLVSAEDDARAILGYSDHGRFDATDMPENMQFWLQMYADELARYEANKPVLKAGQVSMHRAKRAATDSYPTITPILGDVEWGQDEPYNNLCPTVGGERSVTGCVATAISQIMYVHKYPTKGIGSKTYTTESHGLQLNVNFGATTYDWGNMLPYYKNNYNSTQANAVATLMYHVGVAADMDYDPDGSGAISSAALAAITEYFGYNKSIHVLPKDFMKEETVLQTVASDLQEGRPVYISGSTVNQEGHAFVCDGMQSDGYLHINWGWNGSGNGYFALSALDPENQGTGGSASDLAFTEGVCLYTNIKPTVGGEAMPLITVDKLTRTSSDAINKTTAVGFSLDAFTSTGIATAAGTVTYFIYNSAGEEVNTVEVVTFELAPGYYYTSAINISKKLPSSLAEGDYELEIRYVDDNGKDHPILVKGLGEVRVPFTVTSSQFVFGAIEEPEKEMRPFTNADFALIEGSKTWSVDLFSSQFWSDTPSETDVLIRCNLHSNSDKAVVGTYTMEAGTIDANAIYAEGYYNACYQYQPTALHLTILPAGGEKVIVQYYMEVNGEVKQGSYTATPDWYTTIDGDTYQYNTDYTFDLATALPASKALQMTKALGHTNATEMSYFVGGIISNMRNTPEQIVQYKSARFDISDDGTTNNQFYCYNTKWLDNTAFVSGNEVALGDEVVIYGQVQNYMGNTPEIKGYVYQYTAGEQPEVDYSIRNLQVTTNQDTVFFNFECEAPYFHVKVTDANGETAANGIIDFTNVYVADLADGTYTLWIRPVDEAQEYYIGDAVEEQFEINTTATGIEDLETQQTVVLYDLMGRLVDSKQSGDNRPFDVPADGVYIQRMGEKTTTIYINKR
ncbi:MAG: C10 family peptidase [Paludibacteraceae bacterium]|nr:C10 family peptidase [Paludibacteraceae bacterium]